MIKINTLYKTRDILKKYNLKAKKKFGQNFLIDDNILDNIAKLKGENNNDLIIEIGPGLGNLTEYMLDSNLLLVEIDKDMIEILNNRFSSYSNVTLINEDILKINIDEKIKELEDKYNKSFENVKVVANLPYYITSPILFKLLENSKRIKEIIVMVQKEVADRIVASNKNKDYGILTLMIQYFGQATKEIEVSRNCFVPAPNVESSVIKIEIIDKNQNINYNIFKELVHKSFANRRKKMINSLYLNNFMNKDKAYIEKIFENLNLSINTRAEELEFKDYLNIVKYVKED